VRYKKSLLVALTIVLASWGGGKDSGVISSNSGTAAIVNNPIEASSNLASGFLLMPAVY
jgi:hypothetical protein